MKLPTDLLLQLIRRRRSGDTGESSKESNAKREPESSKERTGKRLDRYQVPLSSNRKEEVVPEICSLDNFKGNFSLLSPTLQRPGSVVAFLYLFLPIKLCDLSG